MKTINVILKVIVGAFLAFSVTACSKDKKSNNGGYYNYNNGQYILVGNQCVSRYNQTQVVPYHYCQMQGGVGGYGNLCVGMYQAQDGTVGQCCPPGMTVQMGQCVPMMAMGGMAGMQQMPGMPGMQQMPGMPNNMMMGNNCTGWYLQNTQTGQWQLCQ